MLKVDVDFVLETSTAIKTELISDYLELILRRLGRVGTVMIEVKLVENPTIQQLNKQHLGVDAPTDVLSFPSDFQTPETAMLGSIVIAEPVATKQAEEAGISLIEELKMLSGHGLLHLLGYHH